MKPGQKIGKNLVIYLGSAWVIMEAFNFFIERYNIEPLLLDILIIFLVFGLFISVVFHSFKGRWNKKAVALQTVIVILSIFTVRYFITHPLDLNPRALRIIKIGGEKSPLKNLESVAVLPVQNNLPNKENDYLLAGLHDGIITELGKLGTLKTISRTSMLQYVESNKSIKVIGKELEVNTVLESSLSPAGSGYVYRVKLIDSSNEDLLWSDEFSTRVSELPTLFDVVARIIATKLNPEAPEDKIVHENVNPKAYKEIIKGNQLLNRFTKSSVLESLEYFNRAIEYDSVNIAGYLGVASAWMYLNQLGMVDPKIAKNKILEYGQKAVDIDPGHWSVLDYLAYKAAFIDYDFKKSIEYQEKSLQINPNNSSARIGLAFTFTFINDWENANKQLRYAKEIDPFNPNVLIMEVAMLGNGGKILSALKAVKKLAIIEPEHPFVKVSEILMNREFGNSAEAIQSMKAYFLSYEMIDDPLPLIDVIDKEYSKTKDVNSTWLAVIRQIEKQNHKGYFPTEVTSLLYKILPPGYDDDWFFENLTQLAKDRHPEIPYFAIRSNNTLQDDSRYIKIMEDLGLW